MNSVSNQAVPRATLVFILASAFLTSMGFGLVGPVLPYLVGRWVSDPGQLALTVSLLSVSYALCSFIAAPLLGQISKWLTVFVNRFRVTRVETRASCTCW